MGAGNRMPEVTDNRVDKKRFAYIIPVQSPWIRRAIADCLKDTTFRMITPDAAIHSHAFGFGSARTTDARGIGNAHATPEPSVRSPSQAVGEGMMVAARDVETIEQY